MAGEKPTSKALQLKWQGALGRADGTKSSTRSKIAVIGVGDAGNNTVTQLTKMGTVDVYKIAIHSDPHHLSASRADKKILIGKMTRELSEEGDFTVGKATIKKSRKPIEEILANVSVVFITTSLGCRTGTKATPVIAQIAKKKGATTIGVVTKPYKIQKDQTKQASHALTKLRRECDTAIVIDNNKLIKLATQLSIDNALQVADQIVANIIKSLMETISASSLLNLDFANFQTIIKQSGGATVGIGESDAPNRAKEAVHNALKNPLLDIDCAKAKGALIYVTGDNQMTIDEANCIGEIVTEMLNKNAQVIWGAKVTPELHGKIRVTLVMTGINSPSTPDLGSITPQLFNLEPYAKSEKKLRIDLGLYQLENFGL